MTTLLRRSFLLAVFLMAVSQLASAQPVNWQQGIWKGKCVRGAKSLNAQLVLAYSTSTNKTTGSLNGKPLSALKIDQKAISFTEGS
jgi:hypothetical protein